MSLRVAKIEMKMFSFSDLDSCAGRVHYSITTGPVSLSSLQSLRSFITVCVLFENVFNAAIKSERNAIFRTESMKRLNGN